MERCCDAHDICYATCNKDKELCDIDFKRCLYNHCDTYDKSTAGSLVVKGCKAAAKMLFTGTITLGCRSYLDAQELACYCPPQSSSSSEKNNNYYKKKSKKSDNNNNYKSNENQKQTPPPPGWKNVDDL